MASLTQAQRDELRAELADRRQRAAARAQALQRDLDDIVTASAEAVRDDEHDPEGPTIAFERSQVIRLLSDARAQLTALDRAERRLAGPEGGRCERCGSPIGFPRLLARPTATRCVGCAT